jgi:hypothetical protein
MKYTNRYIFSAVLALAVVGCAHSPLSGLNGNTPPLKRFETKRNKPYDQPAQAQAFFLEERKPEGAASLDYALYESALAQAQRLPWFSSANNALLGQRSTTELSALSTWQQLGPGNIGGRTRVLQFDPTDPNVIYIGGVAGGVWKSTNAGRNWTPLSDLLPNIAVSALVVDRTNPSRIFVGTGEGYFNGGAQRGAGIFVSNDGGASFDRLASTTGPLNTNFLFVNDLVQSPNSANTFYAATQTGLWTSTDSGATWTQSINATAPPSPPVGLTAHFGGCFDIVARPGGPTDDLTVSCGTFITAATNFGALYRSTDAANAAPAWTRTLQVPSMARASLAIAPSDSQYLYALVAQSGAAPVATLNDGLLGVWRSTDGGGTWTQQLTPTTASGNAISNLLLSNPIFARLTECGFGSSQFFNQGWYDNVIAVDPVNRDRVWAGGIDLFRSDDGGATFNNASYWWFDSTSPNYVHADNHGLYFHPQYNGTSNQTLFVVNDGGIQVTGNAAAPVAINTDPVVANWGICGQVEANLPQIAWRTLNNDYAVTQYYNGAVYPGNNTYFGGTQDNGTSRGVTGSRTWTQILGGDGGYVAVNPSNTNVIYAENTGISLQKSINGGATFAAATTGITDTGIFINPFIMDPNNADRLWTSGSRMWRTDNSATSWTQASTALSTAAPFTATHRHAAYAVAKGNADLVIAGTTQGQILRTTSGTTATAATVWTVATGPVAGPRIRPGAVGMIAIDEFNPSIPADQRIAVAVFTGFNPLSTPASAAHVYKSVDGGQSWVGIDGNGSSRIPNIPVHSVVIDPTVPNAQRLFVGTDLGVFVSTDGGNTWLRENTGFANTIVEHLEFKRNPTTRALELFAFTHGRSVYKTTVEDLDPLFRDGFE